MKCSKSRTVPVLDLFFEALVCNISIASFVSADSNGKAVTMGKNQTRGFKQRIWRSTLPNWSTKMPPSLIQSVHTYFWAFWLRLKCFSMKQCMLICNVWLPCPGIQTGEDMREKTNMCQPNVKNMIEDASTVVWRTKVYTYIYIYI